MKKLIKQYLEHRMPHTEVMVIDVDDAAEFGTNVKFSYTTTIREETQTGTVSEFIKDINLMAFINNKVDNKVSRPEFPEFDDPITLEFTTYSWVGYVVSVAFAVLIGYLIGVN